MTADWSGLAFDADGRLVDLSAAAEVVTYGPPPPVRWRPASDLAEVFGRRACHMKPSGPVFDLRCASEVYESNGGLYVNVTLEAQWYAWLDLDEDRRPELVPRATAMSARHVWIEVVDDGPAAAGSSERPSSSR
ncbi:MAG TPA: hypothetical protein VF635_07630 [Propionibacteriaceae bacterium]|jgi:hypothetical protein